MDLKERLSLEQAEALIVNALTASNVSAQNALSVAKALVAAEVCGQGGHGFTRVADYAAQARSGKVDGNASASDSLPTPGHLKVDANHGFAYPALDLVCEKLPQIAKAQGIAMASVTRSHHCGQLALVVERLADQGLVALMFANAPKAMAPWGGKDPLFGTNPIAFAAPREDASSLVIDLSLSKVARGKVMAANKTGKTIPDDWALDKDGKPTTDPKAALAGTMVPMGDSKGAALALMVELLVAGLGGANFSYEASSFFEGEGTPPGVGQLIIAIAPDAAVNFQKRAEQLFAEMVKQDGVRLPGSKRMAMRAQAEKDGIEVAQSILDVIRKIT